jgi:hypothetical protein
MTAFDRPYAQPLPSRQLGITVQRPLQRPGGGKGGLPGMPSTLPPRPAAGTPLCVTFVFQRSSVSFERVRHFVPPAADESALLIHWQVFKGTSPRFCPPWAERFPDFCYAPTSFAPREREESTREGPALNRGIGYVTYSIRTSEGTLIGLTGSWTVTLKLR